LAILQGVPKESSGQHFPKSWQRQTNDIARGTLLKKNIELRAEHQLGHY
jgi:hypothetical protein